MGKASLKFIQKNWVLISILLIGAFLRLFRINEYMTFLGDEGRDAIVVRNLIVKLDPILIGPGTSVGGMYLGPLYYYFMAPFMILSRLSPVGPAVGVALLGVLTIYLVYLTSKEWFGQKAAVVASLFYAISPTVIVYSRSSWNPNIMPFFALLSIYSVWKVWKDKKYNYLVVAAVSFAFVLQSHYLGLLLAPTLFIVWLLSKVPLKSTLLSLLVFVTLMSPLAIFDLRHDFMNSKALYKFLTVRQETVSIRPWTAIPKTYPIFEQINASLLVAKQPIAWLVTLILVSWVVVYFLNKKFDVKKNMPFYILISWLLFGLIGFGLYKQHIYDHYFGFLFPVPFILLGSFVESRFKLKSKLLNIVIVGFLAILFVINLIFNPLRFNPNRQMQRSESVAQKIVELSEGKEFNIAVVADQNYEDGYQYFMEKAKAKVVEIDALKPETVTNQLFVICEKPKEKCDPTHSSKAEVANFGWSKVENEWSVSGVTIYKLGHTK